MTAPGGLRGRFLQYLGEHGALTHRQLYTRMQAVSGEDIEWCMRFLIEDGFVVKNKDGTYEAVAA